MKAKPPSRSRELLDQLAEVGLPPDAPQLGAYFLGETISMSNEAAVSFAVDLRIGRGVYLKRLRPEAARVPALREQFECEIKALGAIASHGVVRLYHAVLDGPEPYFVTEWVEGRTLRDFSHRFRPLAPHAVMIITCELGRTLVDVHERGIVHGGLGLSRVFVHRESIGRLALWGFERASILDDPQGETPLEPRGTWAGPFDYTAPEQLLGKPVSVKADQFALGVMAYELCTGQRPFQGRTVEAQLELIEAQRYRRVDQVEPRTRGALAEVIERALRFDPAERWPDMGALAKALAHGLQKDLFDDATVEARYLFHKPDEYLAQLDVRVSTALAQKTMALANQGHMTEALAECRRLVLWQPRHAPARELLGKLEAAVAAAPKEEAKAPDGETSAVGAEAKIVAEPPGDEPAPVATSRAPLVVGGVAAGMLAIAALVMVSQLRPAKPTATDRVASALKEVLPEPPKARPFSARLQAPTLASHLPVQPGEGPEGGQRAPAKPVQVDEEALGRLEKRGEFHAVAIGTLLKDKPGSAAEALAYFDKI
ncbi:MAG TPA: protein kinase, partial [Polyangia bacterium]|nr:protein kinase [Polyangia bacterium]